MSTQDPSIRLKKWIAAIVEDPRTDLIGVLEHIQKHCGEELFEDFENDNMDNWMASMENLIDILQAMIGVPSYHTRLARLQAQVDKYPDSRTPEPL